MLNQNEVRHLLKSDIWPDDYSDDELYVIAEKIMIEFEQLRGDKTYTRHIKDNDSDLNDYIKYKIRVYLLQIWKLNPEKATELIEKLKLSYKNIDELERDIRTRETDLEIEKAKKESSKINRKVMTFEEMCIPIETHFKITLEDNITVTKFTAYERRLKEHPIKKSA